jgi:hypothetical protein
LRHHPPDHSLFLGKGAKAQINRPHRHADDGHSGEGDQACGLVQGDTTENATALGSDNFGAEEGHGG